MKLTTFILLITTLIAFAANSILCRIALDYKLAGPVEFTLIRLSAGAVMLLPLLIFSSRLKSRSASDQLTRSSVFRFRLTDVYGAVTLFCYALFFSLAYLRLEAGSGALILFATVQVTMIGISVVRGDRPSLLAWAGITISLAGLVCLLWPGLEAPSLAGSVMMAIAGVSWGLYSLLGQTRKSPVLSTARNFLFTLPAVFISGLVIASGLFNTDGYLISGGGLLLAVLSGAFASGAGYIIWYITLPRISTTVASVSQLAVPLLVVIGGAFLLDEILCLRTLLASILIVSGILMTIKTGSPD